MLKHAIQILRKWWLRSRVTSTVNSFASWRRLHSNRGVHVDDTVKRWCCLQGRERCCWFVSSYLVASKEKVGFFESFKFYLSLFSSQAIIYLSLALFSKALIEIQSFVNSFIMTHPSATWYIKSCWREYRTPPNKVSHLDELEKCNRNILII